MKGNWYFVGIAVGISTLTILHQTYMFFICFLLWLFYLFSQKRIGKKVVILSMLFLLFFYFYIPSLKYPPEEKQSQEKHEVVIKGVVATPITMKQNSVEFTFTPYNKEHDILIHYFPEKEEDSFTYNENIKYGSTCVLKGTLETPDFATNPGQFNYQKYLLSRNISEQLILSSWKDITCESAHPFHFIYQVRNNFMHYISKNMGEETAAWMNAFVLGNDSYLTIEVTDLFKRWGLSHILAISGLHVGLVVGIVYFFLIKTSLLTKEQASTVMLLFLPLYALLAGGEPSVWRASFMVFLFIVIQKFKWNLSITDTLSIVFVLLILIDRFIVYHIGFQLSFIVTFGLILSRNWLTITKNRWWQVLQISFVSQMVIIPIQFAYFYTFQPLSIPLNVIVVPYFSAFVIPYLFLLFCFSPLMPSFMLHFFDHTFMKIHSVFLVVLKKFDILFDEPFVFGDFPLFIVGVYYICFILMMKHMEKENVLSSCKYGLIICLLLISLVIRPYFSPVGTLTMLDIGQGDTFVLELPYNKGVYLIDAGETHVSYEDFKPTGKTYDQILKPYLHYKGHKKIDGIFISHDHMDHVGSVSFLLKEFMVSEIIISELFEIDEDIRSEWEREGVRISRLAHNEVLKRNGHIFQALLPKEDKFDLNDNSLVIYTELGGRKWLFTGDISKSEEKEMLDLYPDLSVDMLKVAHHGSDTSTDQNFVETVNPENAFISVGKRNSHGHPAEEVIETLKEAGVTIWRTDDDGAVQYHFKNNEGTFSTFLP